MTKATPTRTWIEDENRREVSIWFGDFQSEKDLERYLKRFRSELKLPRDEDDGLFYLCLNTCFSPQRGDVRGLIGKFSFSESFFKPVKKALKKLAGSSYNGAIALFDYFTDDEFAQDATRATFVGYFPYDTRSKELIMVSPFPHVNKEKVSVWFGTFPSKEEFNTYFSLPDHLPADEDADYLSHFAEDFKIQAYQVEFAAYDLSRGMRPKRFEDLIVPIPMAQQLRAAILEGAQAHGTDEGNAIYVAFDLDYEYVKATLRRKPKSRYNLHYVGTFDNPEGKQA